MLLPLAAIAVALQCPDGSPPPCGRAPVAAAPPALSVAVLTFSNQSRDSNDAYLADGLADEIASRLGQVSRLSVASRAAVRRIREADAMPTAALGRAVRSSYLVSGTVQGTGARLRVSVELLRANDGRQAWSNTYDRQRTDLLAIQSDVATEVARAIVGRLLPQEQARIDRRPTRNPAAYDRVLRGSYLLARRTAGDTRRAISEFEAAIRLDSAYADASAQLGIAWSILNDWGWVPPGQTERDVLARSEAAANRALALDSLSAIAWVARGRALAAALAGTPEIEHAFRRAIALDSTQAEGWHLLGSALITAGRSNEGVPLVHRALSIEPGRPITLTWLGIERLHAGDLTVARRWLDSALTVAPDFLYALDVRAAARALQGDTAGSRRDAREALRVAGGDSMLTIAVLAFVEARAGDSAQARRLLDIMQLRHDEEAAWAAAALVVLGDHEGALRRFETVAPSRYVGFYMEYAMFDAIRALPRFQELYRRHRPR